MEHVLTIENVRNTISNWKKEGYSIGYVPTMGFLHDGHASLIWISKQMVRLKVYSNINSL